jgi:hypothetical protein
LLSAWTDVQAERCPGSLYTMSKWSLMLCLWSPKIQQEFHRNFSDL